MELILWLYDQPYDPRYPVVCLDERPCFLIGDVVEPIALQTGQVRKEHYAYAKLGSCALFATIEPLTGHCIAQVHHQRRRKEFALAQRFEFFYTPISTSWHNMIEIVFSALTRLCLNRRYATIE